MIFPLCTELVGECIAAVLPKSKKAWTCENYCHVSFEGEQWRGHRLSYHLNKERAGKGPKSGSKLLVLHTCDNKWCINPEHLYLGDKKKNMEDLLDRGGKEYREKLSKAHKKRMECPKEREKMAHAARSRWRDPSQIEAARKRAKENNPNPFAKRKHENA